MMRNTVLLKYECRSGHQCIGYDTNNCLYPPKQPTFIPPERVKYLICPTNLERVIKVSQYPFNIIIIETLSGHYSLEELGIIGYGSTPDEAWINSKLNTSRMTGDTKFTLISPFSNP